MWLYFTTSKKTIFIKKNNAFIIIFFVTGENYNVFIINTSKPNLITHHFITIHIVQLKIHMPIEHDNDGKKSVTIFTIKLSNIAWQYLSFWSHESTNSFELAIYIIN